MATADDQAIASHLEAIIVDLAGSMKQGWPAFVHFARAHYSPSFSSTLNDGTRVDSLDEALADLKIRVDCDPSVLGWQPADLFSHVEADRCKATTWFVFRGPGTASESSSGIEKNHIATVKWEKNAKDEAWLIMSIDIMRGSSGMG